MLNTGLLLSKPGESSYAIYRRMLIANQTPSFITKKMSKEFESIGLVYTPSKELGTGVTSHRLAFLARRKEKRLLEEFNTIRFPSSNIDLYNRYRPRKQCPFCAEIAYHSYLFDLPWMEYCPIHTIKLLSHCPGCRSVWPQPSAIINNGCKICGVNLSIKEIIKKQTLFTGYKSLFNLAGYIEKILLGEHHKVVGRRVNHYSYYNQYSLIFHTPKLKNINVFQASVILRNFDSNGEIKELLNKFGIPEFRVLTRTYTPMDRLSDDQILSENLKFKIAGLVKTKLFGALLKSNNAKHRPGDCFYPENTCTHCATWKFWCAITDSKFDISTYYSLNWLKYLEIYFGRLKPSFPEPCTKIYEYNEFGTTSFKNVTGKYYVPKSLQCLIMYIDLWTLAIMIFHYLDNYSKQLLEDEKLSYHEVMKTMQPFMLPHKSNFCPILMERKSKSEIKVFIPKDLLFTPIPMPNYIQKLAY